ncbi:MAG: hypothetical protein R2697_04955 [Ilumatobacteraceae bacterium]
MGKHTMFKVARLRPLFYALAFLVNRDRRPRGAQAGDPDPRRR